LITLDDFKIRQEADEPCSRVCLDGKLDFIGGWLIEMPNQGQAYIDLWMLAAERIKCL